MYELLGSALLNVIQLKYLVPLVFGTLAGVVGGALPGVTITMTIIVVLPFTFALDPLQGLAAMTGVYVGGSAGGLVTAVLLGIPGTPSAIATTFDGHPMALKGEPGRAIWLGVWASFCGGLRGGVDFLPVLIGVFAFAQIMGEIERTGGVAQASGALEHGATLKVSHLKVLWEIVSRPFQLLWFAFVGVLIGVLPAIGGSAASMMAYHQAKKISRHPERFGTGTPEGIIASESSNNANVGGSLVTIMAFGIPGDAVTAVMLGALTIHGIQSGPLFISQNPELAYGIFAAYLLAHPIMVLILAASARWMLRIVTVPKA